jgi:hypothetical protein
LEAIDRNPKPHRRMLDRRGAGASGVNTPAEATLRL